VIGDFQEPYCADLVEGDDMAALRSIGLSAGAACCRPAILPPDPTNAGPSNAPRGKRR
jgi:hypothetical protein